MPQHCHCIVYIFLSSNGSDFLQVLVRLSMIFIIFNQRFYMGLSIGYRYIVHAEINFFNVAKLAFYYIISMINDSTSATNL